MSGAEAPGARLKDPSERSRRAAARLEGASSARAAGSGVLRGHSRTPRTPRRSLPRRLPYALACALSLSPIVALCGGGSSGAGPESAEAVIPLARARRTESPLPRATQAHGEGGGEALRTPAGWGGRDEGGGRWKWPHSGNDRWMGERRREAARHVTAPRAPGPESAVRGRARGRQVRPARVRPGRGEAAVRAPARPPACPLRRPVLLTRALSRAEMPSATNSTMASSGSGKAGPGGNEQAPAAASSAPQASGGSITSVQTEAMKQILGVIDKKLRNLEKKKVLPSLFPLPLKPAVPIEVAVPSRFPLGGHRVPAARPSLPQGTPKRPGAVPSPGRAACSSPRSGHPRPLGLFPASPPGAARWKVPEGRTALSWPFPFLFRGSPGPLRGPPLRRAPLGPSERTRLFPAGRVPKAGADGRPSAADSGPLPASPRRRGPLPLQPFVRRGGARPGRTAGGPPFPAALRLRAPPAALPPLASPGRAAGPERRVPPSRAHGGGS